MSDTELHIGKLVKVKKVHENETLTEVIIRLLGDVELVDDENKLFDQLRYDTDDDNYEKYFIYNNELYEAEDTEPGKPGDAFCKININEDGSINYVTSFYNGGTCFTEMVEEALEKLQKIT